MHFNDFNNGLPWSRHYLHLSTLPWVLLYGKLMRGITQAGIYAYHLIMVNINSKISSRQTINKWNMFPAFDCPPFQSANFARACLVIYVLIFQEIMGHLPHPGLTIHVQNHI